MKRSVRTSKKLRRFGTTIFSEMTKLALEHEAINLSQGFPDFEGPSSAVDAVVDALKSGGNQYARSMGHPPLVEAIAETQRIQHGLRYDPMTEVGVTSGATEAIAAALLGLLDPGDEVVLFEPFYDSYPAGVVMAGATARYVTLRFPDFALDVDALRAAITDETKAIVINTPHNPTGKVFTAAELEVIAELAIANDLVVISDEVYEYLTYDDAEHLTIASLPGMRERTLRISSAGKSYSFTGWKVGWGLGDPAMVAAMQAAHQFLTFATATPIQAGLAEAMTRLPSLYYEHLRAEYTARRDFLVDALESANLKTSVPKGTYFVLADFSAIFDGDDRAFAKHLIETAGVAAIPPSVFYESEPAEGRTLIRFAFCKRMSTLERAAERLARL